MCHDSARLSNWVSRIGCACGMRVLGIKELMMALYIIVAISVTVVLSVVITAHLSYCAKKTRSSNYDEVVIITTFYLYFFAKVHTARRRTRLIASLSTALPQLVEYYPNLISSMNYIERQSNWNLIFNSQSLQLMVQSIIVNCQNFDSFRMKGLRHFLNSLKMVFSVIKQTEKHHLLPKMPNIF